MTHPQTRAQERTELPSSAVPRLERLAAGLKVPSGDYYLELKAANGKRQGWAAFKTVGRDGKLVLTTVLGPDMFPRGTNLIHHVSPNEVSTVMGEKTGEAMDIYSAMQSVVQKIADYKSNERGEDCGPDEDHDGKISPEELHSHFDHDSDGRVTMQDYARHIALHQAHPEWLADEMAQIVAEYEGVPVKTHGYNSGHEDKMAEEGTATKRNPELWARAKAEAKRKMGGKHSARAMQLAVQIYKKKGGKYSGPKPAADENKMRKWTKQDWQTRPGTDEKAERDDGRTARYLPKAKWESLSKAEQKATDRKKLEGKGQYVENTEKAKVKEALEKISSRLKNPKGGLTAAGREHFKRTEGANLKPGVKNVAKKGDAEKKRWARWAMRFYTNPRGPMKNEKGEPTRLALMANAWGTKVPGTRAEAQAIAARARKMMAGIKAREKKAYDIGSTLRSTVLGAVPGAAIGAIAAPTGLKARDAAVAAIVGAVPSALFDIYNQVTTPEVPAWDPVMRAAHEYGPEIARNYTVPSGYVRL